MPDPPSRPDLGQTAWQTGATFSHTQRQAGGAGLFSLLFWGGTVKVKIKVKVKVEIPPSPPPWFRLDSSAPGPTFSFAALRSQKAALAIVWSQGRGRGQGPLNFSCLRESGSRSRSGSLSRPQRTGLTSQLRRATFSLTLGGPKPPFLPASAAQARKHKTREGAQEPRRGRGWLSLPSQGAAKALTGGTWFPHTCPPPLDLPTRRWHCWSTRRKRAAASLRQLICKSSPLTSPTLISWPLTRCSVTGGPYDSALGSARTPRPG